MEQRLIDLAISQNPHSSQPQDLVDTFQQAYRQSLPVSDILDPTADENAMQKVKDILGGKGK